MWIICFILSLLFFFSGVFLAMISERRKWSGKHPVVWLTLGTVLSSVTGFLPLYAGFFAGETASPLKVLLLSLNNTIRLFVVDCDFGTIKDMIADAGYGMQNAYSILFSVLYVACPILTFGFVLSFFRNLLANWRLFFSFGKDIYVFSELNPKNLALANSIVTNSGKSVIVFTNVDTDDILFESATSLGAICFQKDLTSVHIPTRSRSHFIRFIVQGEDTTKNLSEAIYLAANRRNQNGNETLYFFDTTATGSALFANPPKRNLIIRHINPKQTLIYETIYQHGMDLFRSASPIPGTDERLISVLLIGLGDYGAEMLKTLIWATQMNGYQTKIRVIERSSEAVEHFQAQCPGLFDPAINGKRIPGEAQYELCVSPCMDVFSPEYETYLTQDAADTTYVFIALGNDEMNIAASHKTREIFERMRARTHQKQDAKKPIIKTIVYNSDIIEGLREEVNEKEFSPSIEYFGDLNSSYTISNFFHSDLEKAALAVHRAYKGTDPDFYFCDYNYRSSLSCAIHKKLRHDCGIPGTEKASRDEMTPQELENLARLEHRRWCAYIRGEGYQAGGTKQSRKVDTLAKIHYCLMPYDQLPEDEKKKDYAVL